MANGICGSLVPVGADFGLFSGKDVYEAAAEGVKFVGVLDMAVEGSGVKLAEEEDLVVAGVEAVADGDIDESIFTA